MIVFLWLIIGGAQGCGPGNYDDDEDDNKDSSGGDGIGSLKDAWNGFKVPNETEEQWALWAKANQALQNAELTPAELEKLKEERGPGSGWPGEWSNVGAGFSGGEHAPWAYVAKNTGVPPECLLPLLDGKDQLCETPADEHGWPKENLEPKRWAFNPYQIECVEFEYNGCGGNANNFESQEECLKICSQIRSTGCDPDTLMYVETDEFGSLYD